MARITADEVIYKLTIDPNTGQVAVAEAALGSFDKKARGLDGTMRGLAGTITKWGAIAATALTTIAAISFRAGIQEIEEEVVALRRLAAVAGSTGQSLEALKQIAESLAADSLIQFDEALQHIADLAQKGFNVDQIRQLAPALKDIAAAAGGNVQQNMQRLTDAFTSGRLAGSDLTRMLPGLKGNLAAAGVSMGDFADQADAGKVRQALFNAVIEQGTRVTGAAAEMADTYQGQLQIMKNKIADAQQAFAQGLVPAINQAIGVISTATSGTMGLADVASILAQTIGGTLRDGFAIAGLAVVGFKILLAEADVFLTKLSASFAMFATRADMELSQFVQSAAKKLQTFFEFLAKIPTAPESVKTAAIQMIQLQGQAAIAQAKSAVTYDKAKKDYAAVGAELDKLGDEYVKLATSIGKPLPILKQQEQAVGDLDKKVTGLTDSQKKLIESFEAQLKPADALAKQYLELAKVGVSMEDFIKVYGAAMLEAAVKQREFNEPLSETAKLLAQIAAQKQNFEPFTGIPKGIGSIFDNVPSGVLGGMPPEIMDIINKEELDEWDRFLRTQEALDIQISETAASAYEAARAQEDWNAAMDKVDSYISVFDNLASSIGGLGGEILNAFSAFYKTGVEAIRKGASSAAAYIGALGAAFSAVASSIQGSMGKIVGAVGGGLQAMMGFSMAGLSPGMSAIGGLGAFGISAGSAVGGVAGHVMTDAGIIAMGAAYGAMFAGVGAAFGAAIGVMVVAIRHLVLAMQHDWGEDVAHQFNALVPGIAISTELAESIAKLAEELDDVGRKGASGIAVILSLPQIIQDAGVSAANVTQLTSSLRGVFSFLARDEITLAEATEVLNKSFGQLVEKATDGMGLLSTQMVEIIQLTRHYGLEVQAVTDYINGQLNTAVNSTGRLTATFSDKWMTWSDKILAGIRKNIDGNEEWAATFDKMVEKGATLKEIFDHFMQPGTGGQEWMFGDIGHIFEKFEEGAAKAQKQFDRMSIIALSTFNALIANGATFQEAMAQMGPTFESLFTIMDRLGLSGNAALKPIRDYYDILQKFPKQVQTLTDVASIMVSLANAGYLTADAFNALEKEGSRAAKKIIADGKMSRGEWNSIAPYISTVAELAERYGFKLDKNTQAIIDMARANGWLEQSDATPTLEAGVTALTTAVQELTKGINAMVAAFDHIPRNILTTVTTEYVEEGAPPDLGGSGGAAGAQRFAGATRYQAPSTQTSRTRTQQTSNINISGTVTARLTGVQPIVIKLDNRDIWRSVNQGLKGGQIIVDLEKVRKHTNK